jgi:hypothetical protein
MEEGQWSEPQTGTPQGSVVSPLLESRTGTESCVGVGGVDFLAWCLSPDDVSLAERVAMAA